MNASDIHKCPPKLKCLHCGVPFPKSMIMKAESDGQLRKGTMIICSICSGMMVLGDNDWRCFTTEDFNKLPHRLQLQVFHGLQEVNSIMGPGKQWSPHDTPGRN